MVLQKGAYSWWWVSHIRTKQSKWLQLNLQDMKEKVCSMLEIIDDDDGDSFAKRAEYYFKKRPKLVSIVGECYRAYQALAERYDHLSNDLQTANRTIATVSPEKVPYSVDEDQDNEESATKKDEVPISGLNKDEALNEIDKLRKEISDLLTGREFLYRRLCEIDNEITEKQRRACNLEVEFGVRSSNQKFEAVGNESDSPQINEQKEHVPTNNVHDKVKNGSDEEIDVSSNASRTLSHLEEKIDELVQRFGTWETAFLSEKRLKSEEDELREHDKSPEIMNTRMNMLEGEIYRFNDLVTSVVDEINSLKTHSIDSSCRVDDVSEKAEADTEPVSEMEQAPGDHRSSLKDKDVSAEGKNNVDFGKKTKNKYSSDTASSIPDTEIGELESNDEYEDDEEQRNWRQMYLDGVDDRENVVMDKYSSDTDNYKDVRKKLNEVDKKNREGFFELAMQIRELKDAVSSRDGEIQRLHRRIGFVDENKSSGDQSEILSLSQESTLTNSIQASPLGVDVGRDDGSIRNEGNNKAACVWAVENKIRSSIDELLEENLEFWLRFSEAFNLIKRYETSIQELKSRLREKSNKQQGRKNKIEHLRSEIRPIYCELRELRGGLILWMENNEMLRAEVEGRHFSVCNVENEIASSSSSLSGFHHEAAKFRGEVAKMKREINKICSQMKAGSDRVRQVKVEVEELIDKLEKELGSSISSMSQPPSKHRRFGSRVSLKSFLFGIKLRNSKHFKGSSSMHESKSTYNTSPSL